MFDSLPEPWGAILSLIVGPVGAIVVLSGALYFVWKLFREEQALRQAAEKAHQSDATLFAATISTVGETVKDLTEELRIWREASR